MTIYYKKMREKKTKLNINIFIYIKNKNKNEKKKATTCNILVPGKQNPLGKKKKPCGGDHGTKAWDFFWPVIFKNLDQEVFKFGSKNKTVRKIYITRTIKLNN